jgi:hypothetical protein
VGLRIDVRVQAQRRLQRISEPAIDTLTLDQAVDDDLDGVLLVAE